MKAFQERMWDFRKIAGIIERDPSPGRYLVKLANLASVSRGQDVRTFSFLNSATRIGSDQAKLHIWAVSMKNLYSSPHLQRLWNHSLLPLSPLSMIYPQKTHFAQAPDARLLALLHDLGRLVLIALGDEYIASEARLLAQGMYPVEVERHLCGFSHAEIGG